MNVLLDYPLEFKFSTINFFKFEAILFREVFYFNLDSLFYLNNLIFIKQLVYVDQFDLYIWQDFELECQQPTRKFAYPFHYSHK